MSLPNPKFSPRNGGWYLLPNGVVVWREQLSWTEHKDYSPLELENISRSIEFSVVFTRQREDPDTYKTIKTYWAMDYSAKLAENVSENIILKYDPKSRKIFVSDLTPTGLTIPLSIQENTPELILTRSEPYKINKEQAQAILEKWNYGFGKVSETASGFEFYVTV